MSPWRLFLKNVNGLIFQKSAYLFKNPKMITKVLNSWIQYYEMKNVKKVPYSMFW